MSAPLPQELNRAEQMLEDHHRKKHEVAQMIKFTADEGDQIVTRVRQQVGSAREVITFIIGQVCLFLHNLILETVDEKKMEVGSLFDCLYITGLKYLLVNFFPVLKNILFTYCSCLSFVFGFYHENAR